METSLLKTRVGYGLKQTECASVLNVPLRTYIRYEKDDDYGSVLKRHAMIAALNERYSINESKGLLTVEAIKKACEEVFNSHYQGQIDFCYLFGSYAKGCAKEISDVDLLVSTSLSGFSFIGLSEALHEALHKKVDLVRLSNQKDNLDLMTEVMKDGVKIYG